MNKIKNKDGAFSVLTASIMIIAFILFAVLLTMDTVKSHYVREARLNSARLATNYGIQHQFPSGGLNADAAKKTAEEYFAQRKIAIREDSALSSCSSNTNVVIEIKYYNADGDSISGGSWDKNGVVRPMAISDRRRLSLTKFDTIGLDTVEYSSNFAYGTKRFGGYCQTIKVSSKSGVRVEQAKQW